MGAPRKYSEELRERATRMALDARKDPATSTGAIKRIAEQLGVHPEALRTWVKRAEVDGGLRPGTTSDDAVEMQRRLHTTRDQHCTELGSRRRVCKEGLPAVQNLSRRSVTCERGLTGLDLSIYPGEKSGLN